LAVFCESLNRLILLHFRVFIVQPRAPAKQIAETLAITALQGFSFSFDDNFDDSLTTVFVAHFCS
jgi:hypothetical protein